MGFNSVAPFREKEAKPFLYSLLAFESGIADAFNQVMMDDFLCDTTQDGESVEQ